MDAQEDDFDFNAESPEPETRGRRVLGAPEEERVSFVKNAAPKNTAPKMDVSINSIREASVPNLAIPQLRSKYPLSDRMALSLTQCCGNHLSPRS